AEFLAELRGTPDLRRALVFVLTSSALESDLARVFEHNVAGYFLKSDFHSLLEVLKAYACSCCFPQLHPLAGPGRNVSVRPTPETVHELSVCGIAEDI
ncbi:MAG: hypothetical protein KDA96_25725, partial [Planctomycetaceae bacterium]|nr:hypothetical protein [Planctomycetaceae bacterium]